MAASLLELWRTCVVIIDRVPFKATRQRRPDGLDDHQPVAATRLPRSSEPQQHHTVVDNHDATGEFARDLSSIAERCRTR